MWNLGLHRTNYENPARCPHWAIRWMWRLGSGRVDYQAKDRRFMSRLCRRVWRRLIEPRLAPDCFSPEGFGEFDELSIAKPEADGELRVDWFQKRTFQVEADWADAGTDVNYPFRRLTRLFGEMNLVVLNLETPLTRHPRAFGLFKSPPEYAQAIRQAGVGLVSLANNHIFDAGEEGFADTLQTLSKAGLSWCGAGENAHAARSGMTLEVGGAQICFLSYTQFCNSRFASLAGAYPGILPLDRQLIVQDIQAAKTRADLVVVQLHWGLENQPNVHPTQVDLAHRLVDAGADALIGHHPHVPHGIEIYRGRPILYSLGNLIFAQQNHPCWTHNLLAELIIDERHIQGVILHPVAGTGRHLFQPETLPDAEAHRLLHLIQLRSFVFHTGIHVRSGRGFIRTELPNP